ncbi:unnamed protein product [Rotaria sp. Silwood1]|nr:unnamed protein product [Rotaria sp. Silwood1]
MQDCFLCSQHLDDQEEITMHKVDGKYEAADTLEKCAAKARKDPQAIVQVLDIIKQTNLTTQQQQPSPSCLS